MNLYCIGIVWLVYGENGVDNLFRLDMIVMIIFLVGFFRMLEVFLNVFIVFFSDVDRFVKVKIVGWIFIYDLCCIKILLILDIFGYL